MSDDLVSRLRDAHINSTQRIFGSNIFDEAADAIRLLDERCAQYERRAEQAERALSVLAPVRDILILCGELGGMQPGETMADYLRRLIDEVASGESLRARVREVVGPFAALEATGWTGSYLSEPGHDGSDVSVLYHAASNTTVTRGHFRAARQLMEEVK